MLVLSSQHLATDLVGPQGTPREGVLALLQANAVPHTYVFTVGSFLHPRRLPDICMYHGRRDHSPQQYCVPHSCRQRQALSRSRHNRTKHAAPPDHAMRYARAVCHREPHTVAGRLAVAGVSHPLTADNAHMYVCIMV